VCVNQRQRRKVQFVQLGTTRVAGGLTVLLGAAVNQGSTLFAQAIHGKGWAGAVAQQPLQCRAVVRLGISTPTVMGWPPSHSSRGRDSHKFKQAPTVGVGVAPSRRRRLDSGQPGLVMKKSGCIPYEISASSYKT